MPPTPTPSTSTLGGSRWNTFPGVGTTTLTARIFSTATEPLFQDVIDDNAPTRANGEYWRTRSGRHKLSAPRRCPCRRPSARTALRQRANRARRPRDRPGARLLGHLGLERLPISRIPLLAGPLVIRSHRYGHLLTPPAADPLRGRRGGLVTMQLYDKRLHQIVLLRDALMPFTNWQDVQLRTTPSGLRRTEPARDMFLTELLVRQIRHSSIVDFGRHVVTGASSPAVYGYAASGGTPCPPPSTSHPWPRPGTC